AFAYYDPAQKSWVAEAGTFEILAGSSSANMRARSTFELTRTVAAAAKPALKLSTRSTLQELLNVDSAKAVLAKHLPGMVDHPQLGMAMGLTLEQIAGFVPDMLKPEVLKAIDADLVTISEG
ncbi:MAG: beta-glucosidase, partial [Anaerolineae bacterium]